MREEETLKMEQQSEMKELETIQVSGVTYGQRVTDGAVITE